MSAPIIKIYRTQFRADSTRSGPLSWAQQAMRYCIEWLGEDSHFFNIPTMLPVPGSLSVADVATAVASLIERHEALRTRFADEDGDAVQRVSGAGGVTLRVFDFDIEEADRKDDAGAEQSGDADCVADHAESVMAALRSVPFDSTAEWPVRFALITVRGTPRYLGMIAFHQAVDGAGLEVCAGELRQALTENGVCQVVQSHEAPAWHPIDQAWYERGPYGAWVNDRAVAHWRAELRKVPVPLFPPPSTPPAEPRVEVIGLVSYAAAAASLTLARKSGTTTATVMLAATAAMLGRFTGHSRVPLVLAAGNRFRRQTRDSVTLLVQDALMTVDVGNSAFADIVADAAPSSLVAYSAGHYDPVLIRRVRAEVAAERGVAAIDTSAYFNDLSFPGWEESAPAALSQTEVAELQAYSLPVSISSWPKQDSTLFIHCRYQRGACVLIAVADTAVLPLSTARAFLQAMEELVVRAAFAEVSADSITDIATVARQQEGEASELSGSESR